MYYYTVNIPEFTNPASFRETFRLFENRVSLHIFKLTSELVFFLNPQVRIAEGTRFRIVPILFVL